MSFVLSRLTTNPTFSTSCSQRICNVCVHGEAADTLSLRRYQIAMEKRCIRCPRPLLFAVLPRPSAETLAADPIARPNVIVIMADDIGVEGLNCYGGTSYRTPRLDQMAAEGQRFTHAYAQPLCTNTRIQLMTGLYNNRNWLYFGCLDPKAKTFGHWMKEAGYNTSIAGKWQLQSYDPPDYPGSELRRDKGMKVFNAGFDEYSLWHTAHTEDKGPRYADPIIFQNGKFRVLRGIVCAGGEVVAMPV